METTVHSYSIEFEKDLPEHIELLEEKLYAFNSVKINKHDGEYFSAILRDVHNEMVAGVAGWTWAGVCEITQLWVTENLRNTGIGSRLLAAAENRAKSKGCVRILVRSYSFQAPHFYMKHGYQVEHIVNAFPAGHSYFILTKRMKREK